MGCYHLAHTIDTPHGPAQPIDDEISTQLSQLQHILKAQSQMNASRRLHLLDRARERIAAQEYLQLLTDIEKTIEAGWTKRQKQLARIKKKKTRKLHRSLNNRQLRTQAKYQLSLAQVHRRSRLRTPPMLISCQTSAITLKRL